VFERESRAQKLNIFNDIFGKNLEENMTIDTVITVVVSLVISLLTSALYVGWQLGQYKNKVDNLEITVGKDEHNGLRKTVGDMRDKVVSCETSLKERGPLIQARSPMTLTARGEKFLEESGSKKFVDDNFEELLRAVDKLKPKTAYDVQEDSRKVVENLSESNRLNFIKNYLFKQGETMTNAVSVIGIYLRDLILKNKNWNVDDIDGEEQEQEKIGL
jgi:hypothetical protein